MSKVDETLFDSRTIERFIAEGRVTQAAYDAYLASLEDCAANAEDSNVRMQAVMQRANVIISDD